MVTKIISGGQTGVDQGGLFGARDAGFLTGGYAPKNFLTEDGSNPRLLQEFGLVDSGLDYVGRTRLNVEKSDVTIWFGKTGTPGYWATYQSAKKVGKLFFEARVFDPPDLASLMEGYDVVNIAGNRESKNPGIFDLTRSRVKQALEIIRGYAESLE